MPSHVCQILKQLDYAFDFWGIFLQVSEKKKKNQETLQALQVRI